MVPVTGEVDVVDPDLVSGLDTKSITNIGKDLGDLDVTDDNVALLENTETNTVES